MARRHRRVADDTSQDEGFITRQFKLEYTTRARASTTFASPEFEVAEGESINVFVRRNADGSAAAPATVVVTSAPNTAGAGDFTPVSQTVQFGPNELQKR